MSDSHYPWIPQTAPQKQRNAEITADQYPAIIKKGYFEKQSNQSALESIRPHLKGIGLTIAAISFLALPIFAFRVLDDILPPVTSAGPSTADVLFFCLTVAGFLIGAALLTKGESYRREQRDHVESHILTGTAVVGQHPEIARIFHRIIATDDRTEQTAERYRKLCDAADEARQAVELGVAGPLELEAHNELVERLAVSTEQSIDEHASVRALEKKEQAEIERIQQEEEAKLNDAAYVQDQDAARAASILERAPDLDVPKNDR